MSDATKGMIATVICFAIIGATIVGWAYVAYNPKVCPMAAEASDGVLR